LVFKKISVERKIEIIIQGGKNSKRGRGG